MRRGKKQAAKIPSWVHEGFCSPGQGNSLAKKKLKNEEREDRCYPCKKREKPLVQIEPQG